MRRFVSECSAHMLVSQEQSHATSVWWHRGYGATVARLTPDQKVGSSNLSGLMFFVSHAEFVFCRLCVFMAHVDARDFALAKKP